MANSPIPRYKAPVEARPKIVTGENGARIQVKPDGSRYVIKKGKAPAPKGRGTVRTGGPGTSAAQQIVNAALAPLLSSIKSQEGALRSTQAGQQAALTYRSRKRAAGQHGKPPTVKRKEPYGKEGAVERAVHLRVPDRE